MTKLKSLKLKYKALLVFALAVGVVGLGLGVKAYQSENAPQNLAEAGGTIVVNNTYEAPAFESDPFLGGPASSVNANPVCQAGECTYTVTGDFTDATTTFVSIASPFTKTTSTAAGSEVILRYDGSIGITSVTSTVDLARIYIDGAATTSMGISCGASATAVRTGQNTLRELVTTTAYSVATSSANQVIENNVTVAQGGSVAGGTVAKIMIGSDAPYFICIGKPTDALGLTNADNTFTGKYVVRFKRLIK